ncbi:GTPase-activating Rap/Ran-GAP domain-like protein 3 isoform X3 [Neodiprion fabricii]|uniref:GTPase-activating Rap/Ran-GAP domain-like protein 3 isoform X3 n=1 Tax=Neodiprion fabricii TaxID=2872261 RepID=UPI001ED8EAFE|nr:GTPase-activating Rap/Ran-GAP domain-like protein 3 isoform X3 [Neodiprion fabricii]XP_046415509.1 GTPase-activating Rap/Ran-GAP domain-like protein 3 isoform X3 [Neodiprion fabricii]
MLCLDMKLVSRLRGLSGSSSASDATPRRNRGGSVSSVVPSTDLESDEDDRFSSATDTTFASASPPPRIVRDRSRSVCVPVLNSSQLRHLHRRASHNISPATDTVSRRGVFSRRYYGSIEMLPQVEQDGLENGRRFRVENGDSLGEKEEMFGSPSTPVLENPENQTRWYFKYFLGKLHQNYVGSDQERSPIFLSVVLSEGAGDRCVPHYRAILWRRTGAQKISLPYMANKPMTVKQILSNFPGMDRLDKGPREIFSPDIQKDLLLLEEQEGSVNFKFGVVYAKEGQTTDDEMLSNEKGSHDFHRFLDLLGERIRLKGWDKYRGGLDVKGDMTGKESVYTVYAGHEVMFHVSTMLPHSKDNPQQLERKRHIGNDIVNVIFTDDPTALDSFNPNCIKSQFTHVFAIVSSDSSGWRVAVYCDECVPLFGPSLPCPPVFNDPHTFREFLLVKLINGEKATFNTPTFSQKRERTLDMLIRDLYQEHVQDTKGSNMLNRRALSDVVEAPGRRREETRAVEMVRVGQAYKLEAIVRGLAPTSMATAGPFKPSPWEPLCVYPDFPQDIICGDSWSQKNRMVLSTEFGTFLIEDGLSHRLIFDKSVQIKQLDVVEQHGILLIRAGDRGRDSKIHVFRLSEFDAEAGGDTLPKTRSHSKERKLERTRGCHIYSLTRPGGSHLRMCAAIGRRLVVMQWKHSAAWTAWCPASDTDTVDGFVFVKELTASEVPSFVTIVEGATGCGDWALCCALRHNFELISAEGASRILSVETSNKPHLVAALDLREDEEPELLLCYNNTCHFQKLMDESMASTAFDFHWNSVPTAVVCAFPYVIAFTSDTMEIRLIINGNLVHTMVMPNLNLISSKNDIFFATTAPEFFSTRTERIHFDGKTDKDDKNNSPPASPHSAPLSASPEAKPMRIYKIPLSTLSGTTVATCERRCPSPAEPDLVPAPPSGDANFLTVDSSRALSRSCSSSPTPGHVPCLPGMGINK